MLGMVELHILLISFYVSVLLYRFVGFPVPVFVDKLILFGLALSIVVRMIALLVDRLSDDDMCDAEWEEDE